MSGPSPQHAPEEGSEHRPAAPLPSPLPALQAARGTTRGLFWDPPPEFHEALCTYVGALRAAGLGPVQVLQTVTRTVPGVSPILLERSVARCVRASDRPG